MRRLDQYTLYDRKIIDKIVEVSELNKEDVVFEIGCGNGILTEALCKAAKRVIACEIDPKMYREARTNLNYPNLELYNVDGYKYALSREFNKFVSNIPYSRSKDTIELLATKNLELVVITVQKEFAEKLINDKKAISIVARYCFDIEYVMDVPRVCFKPVPAVDSSIIRLRKKATLTKEEIKAIKLLYSFKGKKVSNAAKLLNLNLDYNTYNKRVEELTPKEVINILHGSL